MGGNSGTWNLELGETVNKNNIHQKFKYVVELYNRSNCNVVLT